MAIIRFWHAAAPDLVCSVADRCGYVGAGAAAGLIRRRQPSAAAPPRWLLVQSAGDAESAPTSASWRVTVKTLPLPFSLLTMASPP